MSALCLFSRHREPGVGRPSASVSVFEADKLLARETRLIIEDRVLLGC
jgi:hypothetical protein